MTARVARLSYFFPAHNEEANLARARRGGARDAAGARRHVRDHHRRRRLARRDPARSPTSWPRRNPGVVRAVHHPTNLGYGAALRSGFRAAALRARRVHRRRPPVPGRGPRPADRRASAEADQPDVVVGYRIKRADPLVRTIYARLYRLANRIFFGLKVRDVDCACKLFRREALEGIARRVRRRVLLGRAADQAAAPPAGRSSRSACRTTRGRPARRPGAKPSVVFRAVRDFWPLRLRMWSNRARGRSAAGPPVRRQSRPAA